MIRPIVHSRIVLQRPAEPAVSADAQLGQDLLDTLAAHADECVGMAANMVGVSKAVIVFHDEARGQDVLMFNPQITRKTGPYEAVEGCLSLPGPYEAVEGCLSLPGQRTVTRYRRITVEYDDEGFCHRTARYEGYIAQIIQHEVDHCAGVLI